MLNLTNTRRGWRPPPYIILLFPAVTFILIMYAYPFILSFIRSFQIDGNLTLGNYRKTLELYTRDILFTFAVTLFNSILAIILGVLLSVYFRLNDSVISRMLTKLYRLPIFIPFVVVAQMMNSFLAPHGLLNLLLGRAGIVNLDRPLQLFNFAGLSFGFIWKLVPFSVLIIFGGFQMIDNSYIEAARSAGANLLQVILKILIPMNRSSILVALVLIYSQIVGTFTLPYMLIGGKIPTTITVDIAHRVNYFRDFGVANALGVFSYIMVIATAVYYLKMNIKDAKAAQPKF
ncbi:binding-protein-dependent transport systems inner membrane component [Candidatus Vecturithrix granuli]|uniref:Binding-protein-dependent transport systems inner membrane component n=1 Tax=Vecturithrix granuli TaxID=1499967 RepID=A0A081C6E3_VECG1|nr:binding-protein-dependent transport systems inner membrane component [Candidatus Vecturithrix granuli]